jgi:hypothetical protein
MDGLAENMGSRRAVGIREAIFRRSDGDGREGKTVSAEAAREYGAGGWIGSLCLWGHGVRFFAGDENQPTSQGWMKKNERAQHGSVVVSLEGNAGLEIPTRRRITEPLMGLLGRC